MKDKNIKWSKFKDGNKIVYNYLKYWISDFDIDMPMNVIYEGNEVKVTAWLEKENGTVLGLILNENDPEKYLIVKRTEVKVI